MTRSIAQDHPQVSTDLVASDTFSPPPPKHERDPDPLDKENKIKETEKENILGDLLNGDGQHAALAADTNDQKNAMAFHRTSNSRSFRTSDQTGDENGVEIDPLDRDNRRAKNKQDDMLKSLGGGRTDVNASTMESELSALTRFLESDATTAEKMERLVAFLATDDHPTPHSPPSGDKTSNSTDESTWDKIKHKFTSIFGGNKDKAVVMEHLQAADTLATEESFRPVAFLEATTQYQNDAAVSPPMMFGGAFLLIVAVLLMVMTKRSSQARNHMKEQSQSEDFVYTLYE